MRCYKIEDHHTSECPKPKEYKICRECAEDGHIWRECTNDYKRCINCHNDHRTLAVRCPLRKEVIKIKRKEGKEPKTYSNAAKNNTTQQPRNTYQEMSAVIPDIQRTIYPCLKYAHIINAEIPGTYQETINKVFSAINLTPIIIPEDPPSRRILEAMGNKKQQQNVTQQTEKN